MRAFAALPIVMGLAFAGPSSATTHVSMSTLKAAPGGDVVVPIIVDPPLDIDSLELEFQYDATVLSPLAAYRTAATGEFSLAADFDAPGVVALTLSGVTALDGLDPEEVAWVRFDVVGPAGSFSDLQWTAALLNGGVLASQTSDGVVSIVAATATLSVPDDVAADSPGTVMVPVTTDFADGAESFDIVVRHNTDVVVPLNVQKTSLTSPMVLNFFLGQPGEVRISLFGFQPISGNGAVVLISYDTEGDVGDATPLDISKAVINEGGIATTIDDGLLTICEPGDSDEDGVADCFDGCPSDPDKTEPGQCGCSAPDLDPDGDTIASCVDNCPEAANPIQLDTDSDTQGDACDCGPTDPTNAPAPEVNDSVRAGKDGGEIRLEWDDEAITGSFRLYRGSIEPGLPFSYDQSCLGGPIPGTEAGDPAVPGTSETLYYLLTRENACGESGPGHASNGTPRPNDAPCGP